jgi:hypothetical protein
MPLPQLSTNDAITLVLKHLDNRAHHDDLDSNAECDIVKLLLF